MELPVIGYVADFSFVIPAIAGIIRFKHLSNAMKVFLLFCSFACVDVAGEMVLSHKNTNNAFLANYFVLGECAFIFTVYFFSIGSKKIKQIISSLAFLFLCIWMVDKIYFETPNQLNVEMAVASRIFIIVISVFMIHTIVKRIDHPLTDEPMFWVSSSTLVYSAGIFLIIGLANELLKMGASYFRAAWYINWSLIIIVNVMYAKGFFCTTKSPEQIAQS
jgi:hypothetical protein